MQAFAKCNSFNCGFETPHDTVVHFEDSKMNLHPEPECSQGLDFNLGPQGDMVTKEIVSQEDNSLY